MLESKHMHMYCLYFILNVSGLSLLVSSSSHGMTFQVRLLFIITKSPDSYFSELFQHS